MKRLIIELVEGERPNVYFRTKLVVGNNSLETREVKDRGEFGPGSCREVVDAALVWAMQQMAASLAESLRWRRELRNHCDHPDRYPPPVEPDRNDCAIGD